MSDDKLGRILVRDKLVRAEDIAHALHHQAVLKSKGKKVLRLGELLLLMEKISLPNLQAALLQQKNKAMASRAETIKAKERADEKKAEGERMQEEFKKMGILEEDPASTKAKTSTKDPRQSWVQRLLKK